MLIAFTHQRHSLRTGVDTFYTLDPLNANKRTPHTQVQLPSYNLAKSYIVHWDLLPAQSIWTYLLASTFSGGCVCIVMSPADTVLSRMYNQSKNSIGPDGKPRGLLYNSLWDCFYKTYKAEGIAGWYKGSFAHLLRIAPHTVSGARKRRDSPEEDGRGE